MVCRTRRRSRDTRLNLHSFIRWRAFQLGKPLAPTVFTPSTLSSSNNSQPTPRKILRDAAGLSRRRLISILLHFSGRLSIVALSQRLDTHRSSRLPGSSISAYSESVIHSKQLSQFATSVSHLPFVLHFGRLKALVEATVTLFTPS